MGHTTRKSHTKTHHAGQTDAVRRPTRDLGHRLAALALEPELEPSSSRRGLTGRAGLDDRLWASRGGPRPGRFPLRRSGRAVEEASSVACGFGLRLWLWSADILKYFLGMPSPKLPVGTSVFSKMKTPNKEVEPRCSRGPRPLRSEWCRPPAPWSRPGWPASSATVGCTRSASPSWLRPGSWRGTETPPRPVSS